MLELVVIAPLSPMSVGDRFESGVIPLHLTTLPKFRVPQDKSAAVLATISDTAANTGPIIATAADYGSFGHAGDVKVTTVEPSVDLTRLHLQLLDRVRNSGGVPIEPAYCGDGYRPHITHIRGNHAVHPGESVVLTSLAVLDCTHPVRRITATSVLAGSSQHR